MKIKRNQYVTVVDNETGKETKGILIAYTPDKILIQPAVIKLDAKKVHFKEMKQNG